MKSHRLLFVVVAAQFLWLASCSGGADDPQAISTSEEVVTDDSATEDEATEDDATADDGTDAEANNESDGEQERDGAANGTSPTPTSEALDIPDLGANDLTLALAAPTRVPTATPTPAPTVDATPTPTAESAAGQGGDGQGGDRGGPAGGATTNGSTGAWTTANSSGSGGSSDGGASDPGPTAPVPAQPAAPTPTPQATAEPTPVPASLDRLSAHAGGIGPHPWGTGMDVVTQWVNKFLPPSAPDQITLEAPQPLDTEAGQNPTVTWPGFIAEFDQQGGLQAWYWYPSFGHDIELPDLGTYGTGLSFDRYPPASIVQTIGYAPTIWWVGSNISIRYAWDPVSPPPTTRSQTYGTVIFVAGHRQSPVAATSSLEVPEMTQVRADPRGEVLYTLEPATVVTVYRSELHDGQNWLVVSPGGDALAGYIALPTG